MGKKDHEETNKFSKLEEPCGPPGNPSRPPGREPLNYSKESCLCN